MALSRENRLIREKDFDRIFEEGKTVKGSFLFIKSTKSSTGIDRFGFVIPARILTRAVDRNRLKRVLSELIRKNAKEYGGRDIVIVVNKKGEEYKIKSEAISLLQKMLQTT